MIRDNSTTKAIKDEGDVSFPASTNFTVWCFQPHQPTVSNVSQTSLVKWQIVFFFSGWKRQLSNTNPGPF
jgi:hypothetical protein